MTFELAVKDLRTLLRIEAERLHQLAQSSIESDEFSVCLSRVFELNGELKRMVKS